MASAGYSGTPLATKLSFKPGLTAWFHAMPASVRAEIGDAGLVELPSPGAALDAAHIFVTDITEDTIREVGLPMGYVDVKVCAVDAVWSGLKLMIRKELR